MNTTSTNGGKPDHTIDDEENPLEALLAKPMLKYNRALEPQSFDQGWDLAEKVAKLKMCGVRTPEDAYMRILFGRSLGLPAMSSVDNIRMLWSKTAETHTPCAYVKVKLGICLSRPDVVEYIYPKKITPTECVWVGKRRGHKDEVEYSFTIDDAVTAKLVDRGRDDKAKEDNNYNKHPKAMLSWRACGRLIDIIASDIMNGLSSREEVEEMFEEEEARGTATTAAPAVPIRDWPAMLAVLKEEVAGAFASREESKLKAIMTKMTEFRNEAPAPMVDDLKAYYNAQKKASTATTATDAPKATGTASANGQAALPTTGTSTTKPATALSGYLPPAQRGDTYEGPMDPPPPFGGS